MVLITVRNYYSLTTYVAMVEEGLNSQLLSQRGGGGLSMRPKPSLRVKKVNPLSSIQVSSQTGHTCLESSYAGLGMPNDRIGSILNKWFIVFQEMYLKWWKFCCTYHFLKLECGWFNGFTQSIINFKFQFYWLCNADFDFLFTLKDSVKTQLMHWDRSWLYNYDYIRCVLASLYKTTLVCVPVSCLSSIFWGFQ